MKKAFTLAEVLITLIIIGIVAVLVIPGVIENYNSKSWSTASDLFQKKLSEATKQMNTQGQLLNYSSTEDFINNGLSKYMKIIKKCSKDELDKCFASSLDYGTEVLDVNSLTAADNFGKDDWTTEPYGVVFDNGVTALILYNKDCSYIDPFNNQVDGTACLAVAYDVNGMKSPNAFNKDLRTLNASLSESACISSGLKSRTGVCVTNVSNTTPPGLTYDECMEVKDELGLSYCYSGTGKDYYAGAVKYCGGKSFLASSSDLAKIAEYVYDVDNVGEYVSGTPNSERWQEIFSRSIPATGNAIAYIANEEYPIGIAFRHYSPTGSRAYDYPNGYLYYSRSRTYSVICVK